MKIYEISIKKRQQYLVNAHVERSLVFQKSLKTIAKSVKYLFSQPERFFKATEHKKRRVSKTKPDAKIVNCGIV